MFLFGCMWIILFRSSRYAENFTSSLSEVPRSKKKKKTERYEVVLFYDCIKCEF